MQTNQIKLSVYSTDASVGVKLHAIAMMFSEGIS